MKAPRKFSPQELAQAIAQLIDCGGGLLVDDVEYIGQGVHKYYFERDNVMRLAGYDAENTELDNRPNG